MNKRANFFAIGLFVLVAAVIASTCLIIFGAGLLNRNTIEFIATFRSSANGLREGAKVKAYGVQIGSVKKVMLHQIEGSDEVVIPVLMEVDLDLAAELAGDGRKATYTEEDYQQSIEAGMHAKLQLESLVTGMLYVELSHGLSRTGYVLESARFADYYNIPSTPTDLEITVRALESVVQNLGKTDLKALISESKELVVDLRRELNAAGIGRLGVSAEELLSDTRERLNSREINEIISELAVGIENYRQFAQLLNDRGGKTLDNFDNALKQLDSSLVELEAMSENTNVWVDPTNPMYNEVIRALDQFNDTSKALQSLLEYLERNPNALITGKHPDDID